MNKGSMFLAAVGLAVLTGCGGNKVMEDRKYVPAKDENAIAENKKIDEFAVSPAAPAEKAPAAVEQPAPAPAPAPAARRYAPMEGARSSGGVSSAPRRARRAGAVSSAGGVYIVKRGDYLGKIARKHGVTVKALVEANKLTERDVKYLRIGRKLVIPAGSKAVKGGKKAAVRGKRSVRKGAAVSAKGGIYVVRPGDFPARIARRHGVKVADLLKANNLTAASSRSLQVGQKLVIPGAGAPAAAAPAVEKAPAAPAVEKAPAAAPAPEVKAADKLADDLEKTVAASQSTGTAAAPADAAPATDLLEITEDISLKDLAAKHNTTEQNLRSINDNFAGDTVKKGTFFFVPGKK